MRPLSITETANIGSGAGRNVLSCLNGIVSTVKEMVEKKKSSRAENPTVNLRFEDILPKIEKETDYVGEMMDLSQLQVLFLAMCFEHHERSSFDLSDLASSLHVTYLRLLEFNGDIQDLRKKGLIRIDDENRVQIPREVFVAFSENRKFEKPDNTGLTTITMMRRLDNLFEQLSDKQIGDEELLCEARGLIKDNPETSFSKAYEKYHIDDMWRASVELFLFLAKLYYINDDDNVLRHQIEDLCSDEMLNDGLLMRLHRESLDLMSRGVIEFKQDGMMKSREAIHIKDDVKRDFFADACTVGPDLEPSTQVIRHDGIISREMFYDPDTLRQVNVLDGMLSEERYAQVQEGLKARGLRTGFSCLFYGSPGTGKTETVYQLARRSGRDLIRIDVSGVKSCWVGESEKNIKGVFEKYRRMVRESKKAPILLFNEADAIFGIRQEGADRAVDKMENSIQNIILQEMEELDGILIATTNLTCNLDKAFERRFLYKIRFEKPSTEAKTKIWRSLLPELSESEAECLASGYDFSGGQIENISRKKMIQSVINGKEPSFEDLQDFCSEELIDKNSGRGRVGF